MLLLLLSLISTACPDALVDSLANEIGNGSTLTLESAESIRDIATTYSLRDTSCEASGILNEIVFDMETLIELKFGNSKYDERESN